MTGTEFNNILTNDIKKVEHNLLSFLPDCKDGKVLFRQWNTA